MKIKFDSNQLYQRDAMDALKTNTVLEAQSHGIIFKTV